jgi:hypothetical protein
MKYQNAVQAPTLRVGIPVILLAVSATLVASDKPRFESSPRLEAVTIDGKFDDWPGNLEPFADKPLSLQFQNDGEYLYMRLAASDNATRMQILRQGLTVWFDPGGGTKKHFGIRYPVIDKAQYPDSGQGGRGGGGYGGHRGGSQPGHEGTPESEPAEPSRTERVDILGPGKDDAREMTRDHLPGIDVALRTEQGILQYELKVPLAKTEDHPMAIEAQAGKPVGFGFDAPKSQQQSGNYGRGGGMGGYGGGMGGRGGGMGGHGGGMGGHGGGGQRGSEAPKPLGGWGTISLARQ